MYIQGLLHDKNLIICLLLVLKESLLDKRSVNCKQRILYVRTDQRIVKVILLISVIKLESTIKVDVFWTISL